MTITCIKHVSIGKINKMQRDTINVGLNRKLVEEIREKPDEYGRILTVKTKIEDAIIKYLKRSKK